MLTIDQQGHVQHPRIKLSISNRIEHGNMSHVKGIVVHQTGSSSAQATFNSYAQAGANGAHFLINKAGTIYQCASLLKTTWHVGKLRSRCIAEHRCAPTETQKLVKMSATPRNRHEMKKHIPDRYPSNLDSIGIELVGQALPLNEPNPDKRTYEPVTPAQNASLKWLIRELTATLAISMSEIFRHPTVSQKNASEAATATW
jgi:N-acetyl-anhydromuramyl-L-alanine amidase AmpD